LPTLFAVRRKGADPHAAQTLRAVLDNTGYTKILLKSDQESSILSLIALVKTQTSIQIIPEQNSAYDHASNGFRTFDTVDFATFEVVDGFTKLGQFLVELAAF